MPHFPSDTNLPAFGIYHFWWDKWPRRLLDREYLPWLGILSKQDHAASRNASRTFLPSFLGLSVKCGQLLCFAQGSGLNMPCGTQFTAAKMPWVLLSLQGSLSRAQLTQTWIITTLSVYYLKSLHCAWHDIRRDRDYSCFLICSHPLPTPNCYSQLIGSSLGLAI